MFSNYGVDRRRRDKQQLAGGDSNLRKLEQEIEPPIGSLALVFTDIKNSTLLWDSYPAPMRSAIKIHNNIMRRQLRISGGYEVKTEGDAFMVAFPSPTSALLWCFLVQQNLVSADWPSEILETDQCCTVTDADNNEIYRGCLFVWGSTGVHRSVSQMSSLDVWTILVLWSIVLHVLVLSQTGARLLSVQISWIK